MREEIMKVLRMIEDGTVNAAQAEELLDAMGVFDTPGEVPEMTAARQKAKWVHVLVESSRGDNVNVKLPVSMLTNMGEGIIKIAGIKGNENFEINQILTVAKEMIAAGVTGEIIHVESAQGDDVHITLE